VIEAGLAGALYFSSLLAAAAAAAAAVASSLRSVRRPRRPRSYPASIFSSAVKREHFGDFDRREQGCVRAWH